MKKSSMPIPYSGHNRKKEKLAKAEQRKMESLGGMT